MKDYELRLGIWLMTKGSLSNPRPFQVTREDMMIILEADNIETYDGVPLDEAWLLESGFKRDAEAYNFYKIEFNRKAFCVSSEQGGYYITYQEDVGLEYYGLGDIEYRHEVQNIISSLTKEEV